MKVKLTSEQVTLLRYYSNGLPRPIEGFTLPGGEYTTIKYPLPYTCSVKITKSGIEADLSTLLAIAVSVARGPAAVNSGPLYELLRALVGVDLLHYVYWECTE